jgi:hypothetical protein
VYSKTGVATGGRSVVDIPAPVGKCRWSKAKQR